MHCGLERITSPVNQSLHSQLCSMDLGWQLLLWLILNKEWQSHRLEGMLQYYYIHTPAPLWLHCYTPQGLRLGKFQPQQLHTIFLMNYRDNQSLFVCMYPRHRLGYSCSVQCWGRPMVFPSCWLFVCICKKKGGPFSGYAFRFKLRPDLGQRVAAGMECHQGDGGAVSESQGCWTSANPRPGGAGWETVVTLNSLAFVGLSPQRVLMLFEDNFFVCEYL